MDDNAAQVQNNKSQINLLIHNLLTMKIDDLFNWHGKLGDYIIYNYRGQKCIRRKPKIRNPPTSMQKAQQERMTSVGIFYKALKDAGLSPYWTEASKGKLPHGYNLVVKENMPAFQANGEICDFTKLQPTPLLLPLPDNMQLAQEDDGSWLLQWTNNSCLPGAAEDDLLRVFLMRDAESFNLVPVNTGNARRGDGKARFSIGEALKDYPHLYALFCSSTGWRCTNSRYFHI